MSTTELNLQRLAYELEILAQNSHVKLDDLHDQNTNVSNSKIDERVRQAYTYFTSVLSTANGSTYQSINKLLQKLFRPSIITPNTIGSFLFGCRQESYGETNRECSPLCSIDQSGKTCRYQVWSIKNKEAKLRFEPRDLSLDVSTAYVFVDPDFIGFTREEIDNFKRHGVLEMQIFVTTNNKHFIRVRMDKLDKMPITYEKPTGNIIKGNYFWLYVLTFFLIIITVLFLYWIFFRRT